MTVEWSNSNDVYKFNLLKQWICMRTLGPQGICSSLMCKCMLFDIKLIESDNYQSTKESYE